MHSYQLSICRVQGNRVGLKNIKRWTYKSNTKSSIQTVLITMTFFFGKKENLLKVTNNGDKMPPSKHQKENSHKNNF